MNLRIASSLSIAVALLLYLHDDPLAARTLPVYASVLAGAPGLLCIAFATFDGLSACPEQSNQLRNALHPSTQEGQAQPQPGPSSPITHKGDSHEPAIFEIPIALLDKASG